ncbi:MAG: DUF4239 domain-containing protein [Actinobacteria bacterium]|jgi:hypothetical protein|uniref:Unannotated protein n=1 Tax=freshwater metagenome TaxID=449393 RepID=A0A6J6D090_9ZZZZ|nr:DUF4239 domain-containing protein [Actinomycetota bacterium]
MFLRQSNGIVLLFLVLIVGGAIGAGIVLGRRLRERPEPPREPVGVVQGALLGLVGLLLAFGLSMAVSRYEARRTLVVAEANAIGTTYLRAQLLAEPARSESLELLRQYTDAAIDMARAVPDSPEYRTARAEVEGLHDDLWALAGDAVRDDPTGTAPRLYVETLNETIDAHGLRVASLGNRVPTSVQLLQIVSSAVALAVLAMYLAMFGRNLVSPLLAGAFVVLILFVSFDLDRPRRGFITVPDRALVDVRASMDAPPAAIGP